jgi:hypothetical protein
MSSDRDILREANVQAARDVWYAAAVDHADAAANRWYWGGGGIPLAFMKLLFVPRRETGGVWVKRRAVGAAAIRLAQQLVSASGNRIQSNEVRPLLDLLWAAEKYPNAAQLIEMVAQIPTIKDGHYGSTTTTLTRLVAAA